MERRKRFHGEEFHEFFLMAIQKKGPLTLKELEETVYAFVYHFYQFGYNVQESLHDKFFKFLSIFGLKHEESKHTKMKRWREHYEEEIEVKTECQNMVDQNLLVINDKNKYELTDKGKEEAKIATKRMEKAGKTLEEKFLSPDATAKNTVIADFFLAVMKLLAGFFTGSVGLLADGADAAVDTVSASLVWIGIKFDKEFLGTLIIILMMFVTATGVGYESIMKIWDAIFASISPISMPYLVILVEGVSLIAALFLYMYQRFVGRRNGSLVLISQSVDSKNHIYVAGVVMIGAIFSIFGIHYVDALIGVFIAAMIFLDASELSKEALFSYKGEDTDFSKYEVPFETHWHLSNLETFRTWILYSIKEDALNKKEELIDSLEITFDPEYIPILGELRSFMGEDFDFRGRFDELIKPLEKGKYLIQEGDTFILTEKGKDHVENVFKTVRLKP